MNEHLSMRDVERYRARALSPGELLAVDDHIAACPACSGLLASRDELRTMFGSLQVALGEKTAVIDAEPVIDVGRGERQRSAWTRFGSSVLSRPHRAAFAAAAALMVAMLVWFIYQAVATKGPEKAPPEITHEGAPAPQSPSPDRGPDNRQSPAPAPFAGVTNRTGHPGVAVVELQDGDKQVTLDLEGNLSGMDSVSPSLRRAVQLALGGKAIEKPEPLLALNDGSGTQRGTNTRPEFKLASPVATVIESDRPTFRWQPLDDAESYTVEILDSHFEPVMRSDSISSMEWIAPKPLLRGKVYSWQVTAVKKGARLAIARPASFRVLDEGELVNLQRERVLCGESHLALGLLYARAGIIDRAESELAELAAANPSSPVVKQILRRIRSWR